MRFEEHASEKAKRRIKAFVFLIFLFSLLVMILRYPLSLPYFEINNVRVEGENRLSEAIVLQWANVPLRECIFEINLRKIAQRLELKPRIKRAEVKRRLPSTVTIHIEERMPFVYLNYKNLLWEVDEEGVILGEAEEAQNLPVITGLSSFSETEKIKQGLKIVQISKKVGVSFSEINVQGKITGYLKGGIKVYLGDRLDYLSYLPLILADIKKEGKKIEYIDLRFNGQIVVKPK